jgi:PAS domain S-box-containing protein
MLTLPSPTPALAGMALFLALLVLAGFGAARARAMARAAARARRRYQALLDNLPGIVLRAEARAPWRVKMVSRRVSVLLGDAHPSLVGRPFAQTPLAPDGADDLERLEHLLQALGERPQGGELSYRYHHPDGSLRWFEANVRPSTTPGSDGAAELDLLLQDVTERQHARQHLEVAQSIIRGSRDAIVSKTLQGDVTSWNAGAAEVFGYSAAEAMGMPITRLFREQDLYQEQELMARIRRGLDVPPFDAVRVRKDGRQVHVSVSLSPIRDDHGLVVGASKIARDISDRKLNEALRRDVAHAEQMAATRTAFLARMSHELRTPMTAVMGFGSVLLQSPLSDEQRGQVQAIRSSARHLLRLLDDVLDTARLDKGELVLHPEAFRLTDLLAEVHAQFDPVAAARHLALKVDSAPGTPAHFLGDAQRVRQIVFHLVDNALKFTRAGEVAVHASHEGGVLRLVVSDTGVGMSAEQLARIFDPFVQADTSLGRAFGGIGLGLTLCQQLSRLMGGEVLASSTPGQGSHMVACLPLPLPASPSPSALEPAMPADPRPTPAKPGDERDTRWVDEPAGTAIWGGMAEVWRDALRQFDAELGEHLERIRAAFGQADAGPALEAVHALRGAAATVALPALFQRLDTLEGLLRAGDLPGAAAGWPGLEGDAAHTREGIAGLLGPQAPGAPVAEPLLAAIDLPVALAQLARMREQLGRSEVPSQALAALRKALGGQYPAQDWQRLGTALDSFEYGQALERVAGLETWLHTLAHPRSPAA